MNSNIGKITLKNLNELLIEDTSSRSSLTNTNLILDTFVKTPVNQYKANKKSIVSKSTSKKSKANVNNDHDSTPATAGKGHPRTGRKEPPPNQLRIDRFFQSASKTHMVSEDDRNFKTGLVRNETNKECKSSLKLKSRKRIYNSNKKLKNGCTTDSDNSLEDFESSQCRIVANKCKRKSREIEKPVIIKAVIDLCSDSENDEHPINESKYKENSSNEKYSGGTAKPSKYESSSLKPEENNIECSINMKTPSVAQDTPMFTIPTTLATTKRRLRYGLRSNAQNVEESTPSLWTKKITNVTTNCQIPSLQKSPNSSTISVNAELSIKKHKRKISFSSIEDTPLKSIPLECKDTANENFTTEKATDLSRIDDAHALETISCDGDFDLGSKELQPKKVDFIKNTLKKTKSSRKPKHATISEDQKPENVVTPSVRKQRAKIVPAFKIIDGTTFVVDGFCYGYIEGITHYFLSHYHADHYMGLSRKFAMPLYASAITARLIQTFTPIDTQYLHILNENEPQIVNDIEVTAIDANHCPGAVMFVFKLRNGRCILHTGDFRASPEMESEPIFWNNHINTIYLDTTYISDKYAFCPQFESIEKAIEIANAFKAKHCEKKILIVCGSYVIGKEKFWVSIAEACGIERVWTEGSRRKALDAMEIPQINKLLCNDPLESEMHIIPLGKLSYPALKSYFDEFQHKFDILLAFRPSGWEKNAKPQYRGIINIVGIEYSEHSSYEEMQRFVKFLKPDDVISTVPFGGHNSSKCPEVPKKWYKYEKLAGRQKKFQTSISSYFTPPGKIAAPKKAQSVLRKNLVSLHENVLSNTCGSKSTPLGLVGSERASSCTTVNDCHEDASSQKAEFGDGKNKLTKFDNEKTNDFLKKSSENEDTKNDECFCIISSDSEF